jgi:putative endonuclease
VFQHKFHRYEGFTSRYEVVRLLYFESYDDVHKALGREKQLKGWSRAKKVALLERRNPQWRDLAAGWYPWMEQGKGRDAANRYRYAQHDRRGVQLNTISSLPGTARSSAATQFFTQPNDRGGHTVAVTNFVVCFSVFY